jgi:DNA-directed RNA polymerase specialized sigma subunit
MYNKCKRISPMPEGEYTMELICKTASGDVEAKLQLVKDNLDLVVEIAACYASEYRILFPDMVKVGTLAVIRAADNFYQSQQMSFDDYVRDEITRSIKELV